MTFEQKKDQVLKNIKNNEDYQKYFSISSYSIEEYINAIDSEFQLDLNIKLSIQSLDQNKIPYRLRMFEQYLKLANYSRFLVLVYSEVVMNPSVLNNNQVVINNHRKIYDEYYNEISR